MKKINKFGIIIIITILLELFVFNFRFFLIKFSGLESSVIEDVKMINESDEQIVDVFKKHKTYKAKINQEINSVKLNFNKVTDQNINVSINFLDEGEIYVNKEYGIIEYNMDFKNSEYFYIQSQNKCFEINLVMESTEDFELKNIEINDWYYEFNLFRVFTIIVISAIVIYWKEINEFFNKGKKLQIGLYATIIAIFTVLLRNLLCKISK